MLPDELLAQVQKPARYIGSEFNAIFKDPRAVSVRFVLCYPDGYEVGMSHVGSQILYHVINERPDALCERAFNPYSDAALLLRQRRLPLCSLESGTPLAEFHVVGVTLQHELTYPTVLSLLELGRIPLLASERGDHEPIVLGGGPGAYNPEPLAPFFDAFAIGDGEDTVGEVAEAIKASAGRARKARLEALANIPGVYVPAIHDPEQVQVSKRVVENLDAAPYPTRPIVPFVEVVHDRAQIEVARGCTRGCRFCQAGMVYRPVRQRSPEVLRRYAQQIIEHTGYDEVSLVSLNCPDYPGIEDLIDALHQDLGPLRVSVGLPSLRIDTFSVDLARRVQRVRKSGLTFAPEAGSQRLRDAINKGVTEEDLFRTVEAAFASGWHTLKLYFMIGLPTETDEDVLAIAQLVRGVARVGRQTLGPRAGRMKINVSVACFVPKPHTPLQWEGQMPRNELIRRQNLLRDALRDRQINLSCHDADQSVVEAALARGSRQTALAILAAYEDGAGKQGDEPFPYQRWQAAFQRAGLSLEQEAERHFHPGSRLPWDHIDTGVSREFLLAERERVFRGETTPDCRSGACSGCGVNRLVRTSQCSDRTAP